MVSMVRECSVFETGDFFPKVYLHVCVYLCVYIYLSVYVKLYLCINIYVHVQIKTTSMCGVCRF